MSFLKPGLTTPAVIESGRSTARSKGQEISKVLKFDQLPAETSVVFEESAVLEAEKPQTETSVVFEESN